MRFNPPPNWPPPPPGWIPDSNWTPDPAWPAPPPGWQLWVDDPALPYPPGMRGMPGPPAPYPPYQQWPAQPAVPAPRTWLWLALGVPVVVLIAIAGLVFGLTGRLTAEEKPSKKPDIKELTGTMLVDRSVFPDVTGGKWISGVNSAGTEGSGSPNLKIDPPECGDLYGDTKAASQTATATLAKLQAGGLSSTRVRLAITPERRNVKDYLQKCQTFTQTVEAAGRNVTTEVRVEPLDAAGVPPWALGSVMSSSSSTRIRLPLGVTAATISGYYRGVLVVASSNEIRLGAKKDSSTIDSRTADELVKLFNTQVEKLEAAP